MLDATNEAVYLRALARADDEKITIRQVQPTAWIATNPANGHEYLILRRGNALECSCPAGANDRYCKHRAKVRASLLPAEKPATDPDPKPQPEQERINWLGMTRDERAAWTIAHWDTETDRRLGQTGQTSTQP